eukprot:UN20290
MVNHWLKIHYLRNELFPHWSAVSPNLRIKVACRRAAPNPPIKYELDLHLSIKVDT